MTPAWAQRKEESFGLLSKHVRGLLCVATLVQPSGNNIPFIR